MKIPPQFSWRLDAAIRPKPPTANADEFAPEVNVLTLEEAVDVDDPNGVRYGAALS